jgi:hypothetical protein
VGRRKESGGEGKGVLISIVYYQLDSCTYKEILQEGVWQEIIQKANILGEPVQHSSWTNN